ncbi:MAG: D-tyrosyl-tRNA(Tyr) deacylase [Bacteroidetes bacterium]|nr:D-tyrosyl-tRNA(Tyr) deacylase [Bacteroidota bacterium]
MRALIQRVTQASVQANGILNGSIQKGFLVFLGIEESDTEEDLGWLSRKIVGLRLFDDDQGLMNLGLTEVGGDLLLVSQFTLHAATKKGNRPSFIRAARPEFAQPMYEKMIRQLTADLGKPIATGVFGAHMEVELVNDGPVTIWIDTQNKE